METKATIIRKYAEATPETKVDIICKDYPQRDGIINARIAAMKYIIWEEKEVTHWNLIGSPVHVKRILMNILSNAVKYNKENGYVYISCREIPSKQTAMTTLEKHRKMQAF